RAPRAPSYAATTAARSRPSYRGTHPFDPCSTTSARSRKSLRSRAGAAAHSCDVNSAAAPKCPLSTSVERMYDQAEKLFGRQPSHLRVFMRPQFGQSLRRQFCPQHVARLTTRKSTLVRIPRCHRGLTLVRLFPALFRPPDPASSHSNLGAAPRIPPYSGIS